MWNVNVNFVLLKIFHVLDINDKSLPKGIFFLHI